MTAAPLVSVIVPTRDRRSLLAQALASVSAQDLGEGVELIVVDDGSTDGSAELVRASHPAATLVRLARSLGRAEARNRGLAVARGRHVAFLDDDDLWEPAYLRIQLARIAGERAFSVSALLIRDEVRGETRPWLQRPDPDRFWSLAHQLLVDNHVYTLSSVVYPAAVLRELGGFDASQEFGCDVDLMIRCLLAGVEPRHGEQPLVTWRLHRAGQSVDRENQPRRLQQSLARARRYHAVLGARFAVPSLERLRCELIAHAASMYLHRRDVARWIAYHAWCGAQGAPGLALSSMARDVRSYVRSRLERLAFARDFGGRHAGRDRSGGLPG